jgi:hypothetical protein
MKRGLIRVNVQTREGEKPHRRKEEGGALFRKKRSFLLKIKFLPSSLLL